ncbi:MAG: transporter substrate-binding domain-containing protein [Trueperaceae bacterium]|nr:transporter substrate-binding domain-containing protein [Trueperaceae bacterium]
MIAIYRSRRARFFLAMFIAMCVALLNAHATAQFNFATPDFIPPEFLENRGRQIEGDTIRFCLNEEGALKDFERAVGTAVADALLLEAEFTEVRATRPTPAYSYRFPVDQQELFVLLTNDCVAFPGFLLGERNYPDWLIVSRAYLETSFVFATTDDAITTDGLSSGAKVGTRMLSQGDLEFTAYNGARPEGEQLRRIPYPGNELLFERLADGTLDAALAWKPGIRQAWEERDGAPALTVWNDPDFEPPTLRFAIGMRSRDEFLRASVDEALTFLIEDGVIADLLERFNVAGTVPRP